MSANRDNEFYWLRPQSPIDYRTEKIDYQFYWEVSHKRDIINLGDLHINVDKNTQVTVQLDFSIGPPKPSSHKGKKGLSSPQMGSKTSNDGQTDEVVVNVYRVQVHKASGLLVPRKVNAIQFKI